LPPKLGDSVPHPGTPDRPASDKPVDPRQQAFTDLLNKARYTGPISTKHMLLRHPGIVQGMIECFEERAKSLYDRKLSESQRLDNALDFIEELLDVDMSMMTVFYGYPDDLIKGRVSQHDSLINLIVTLRNKSGIYPVVREPPKTTPLTGEGDG